MGELPSDQRRNPKRGVRVIPLPKVMHARFAVLCSQLRDHARSHRSTWALASRIYPTPAGDRQLSYWDAVIKYINTLEYLGTVGHDTGTHTRRPKRHRS